MQQPRRKIVLGVMIPAVIALIVLRRTMGLQSMSGVAMINIESLLLTGALLGIAVGQAFSAFRKGN